MKTFTFHTIAGLLAIGMAFGVRSAQAQAGSLDTTFGTGGIVTSFIGNNSPLNAVEQSNGDIAAVTGLTDGVNMESFALVRYTSRGTQIGITTASFFSGGISSPSAVAVQPNGDIVVVGTAQAIINAPQVFAVARFTPNGK